MAIIKGKHKIDDGVDFHEYHYVTDADIVKVEDKNNKINADNVEGALEEIVDKIQVLNGQGEVKEKISKTDFDTFKQTVTSDLAEKVTKPTTAVGNNIAIFDTNQDKLKDSGKSIGNTAGKILELPTGLVAGDLFYVNAGGQVVRLPKGSDGQGLVLSNGLPIWGSAGTKIVYGKFWGDKTKQTINIGFKPHIVILTKSDNYGGGYGGIILKINNSKAFYLGTSEDSQSGLRIDVLSLSFLDNGFDTDTGDNYQIYDYIAIG